MSGPSQQAWNAAIEAFGSDRLQATDHSRPWRPLERALQAAYDVDCGSVSPSERGTGSALSGQGEGTHDAPSGTTPGPDSQPAPELSPAGESEACVASSSRASRAGIPPTDAPPVGEGRLIEALCLAADDLDMAADFAWSFPKQRLLLRAADDARRAACGESGEG